MKKELAKTISAAVSGQPSSEQSSTVVSSSAEDAAKDVKKDKVQVDLIAPNQKPRQHTHRARKVIASGVMIIFAAAIAFGSYAYSVTKNQITEKKSQVGFLGQLHRIIDEDAAALRGEDKDRTNILLLGEGGLNHPGGTLTDTIMIVSIKPSTNQVALLSIPRDLVVAIDEDPRNDYFEYRKINYAVEIGGIELAQEKIKEVTGLTINYYVLADFTGFKNIIDDVGGLDIYVENGFTDYQYPDYNYGYQPVSFKQGWQHFNGEQALQYARSRHGNNGEGSDFARARRQQQILEALREKTLRATTFFNPSKVTKILNDLGDHLATNAEIWEMMRFATMVQQLKKDEVINKVVDDSAGGLLVSQISSETGAYVLVPRAGLGNYTEIKKVAADIFNVSEVVREHAVVSVQNGSSLAGLAASAANLLRAADINVVSVSNAKTTDVKKTKIYDFTGSAKAFTKEQLTAQIPAKVQAATIPKEMNAAVRLGTDLDPTKIDVAALPAELDFLVLVGQDFNELLKTSDLK